MVSPSDTKNLPTVTQWNFHSSIPSSPCVLHRYLSWHREVFEGAMLLVQGSLVSISRWETHIYSKLGVQLMSDSTSDFSFQLLISMVKKVRLVWKLIMEKVLHTTGSCRKQMCWRRKAVHICGYYLLRVADKFLAWNFYCVGLPLSRIKGCLKCSLD